MDGPTPPRPARAEMSRLLRLATRKDLFSVVRTDEQLGRLVRHAIARVPRPFATLLGHLIGSDSRLEEKPAREFWLAAVAHRRELASALGRPVSLRVAALDLMSLGHAPDGLRRPRLLSPRVVAGLVTAVARDALTGLYNRERFEIVLEHELRQRARRPVLVAFLDIDGFKAVNDEHGHARGDRLLASIGAAWHRVGRRADALSRYGGDEFAIAFRDTTLDQARRVVKRLSASIAEANRDLQVGFSVGFAAARPDDTVSTLLGRADRVMYVDKRRRRRPHVARSSPTRRDSSHRVAVFATRSTARLLALHGETARRGMLLYPAGTAAVAEALTRLVHPHLFFADFVFPPAGGEALLRRIRELPHAPVTLLVSPAGWSARGRESIGAPSLRFPFLESELQRALGPPKQRPRPHVPLEEAADARALATAVSSLITGSDPAMPPDLLARPEIDLLRRLLGT